MNKKCLIISGGDFSPVLYAQDSDMIIACDKGYEYAKRCGITPTLVVGDFDSYEGELESGLNIERFPSKKDDTDTMIAVRRAVEAGCDEIFIECALGGRFDHLFANLQAASFAAKSGTKVYIGDENTKMIVFSGREAEIRRDENFSVSVFSLSDKSEGVYIKGLEYEVENAVLENTFPIGTSNEWRDEKAYISVKNGVLAVVMSRL
ncbi:MAG: thiamine diphosphokinase [Clostridiales bacterium]|nr:thiamine diphosphokinase [Clostridiales bacterium]